MARTRSIGVEIAGLAFPTPVLVASGCAGTGKELHGLVELKRLGGIVSRTITVEPREGSSPPRVVESPSGVVWETGLQNPGIDAFVAAELPALATPRRRWSYRSPADARGVRAADGRIAGTCRRRGHRDAISGPDESSSGPCWGRTRSARPRWSARWRGCPSCPCSRSCPAGSDVVAGGGRLAGRRRGAHPVRLTPALARRRRRPRRALGASRGVVVGPRVNPLDPCAPSQDVARALPEVPSWRAAVSRTGEDAIEAMLAGAIAVQVGTATLVDPAASGDDREGHRRRVQRRALASPEALRGTIGAGDDQPAPEEQRT